MPELRPRKPAVPSAPPKEKTSTKRKVANDDASPVAPKKVKKEATTKKSKRSEPSTDRKVEDIVPEDDSPSSDDEEAQALARVVDSDDEANDAGLDEEIKESDLPEVPKDVVKAANSDDSETGVVYIGRIPRGFYEHQMREYFTQFGQVNKIRLSRNKVTGQSKHFAFIEFAELGVAEIVAKTMDNYLLAGHILKVKMVPKSQIHDKLWVGANRRFKKIPWNKMAGNKLKKPLSESTWTKKISKEETKRTERAKKLLEIGYEFEAPKIRSVHEDDEVAALEATKEDGPKEIEAAPQASEEDVEQTAPITKKTASKGDKKQAAKTGKKAKKGKKIAS